ncbi:arsenate reductase family protein [Pararhizobium sp. YC-54]|uniref:arsenate reductase family protein n=1 Tax=Pararhizobium sp. YC-54 TaxID=2986920 RepID=UPI00299F48E2|nr:arsenate reductase family protein [Pararhizobium sp. YC-54]
MSAMIYHNDRCGTSLAVVDIIREAGIEPAIVDYMATPPSHEEMLALLLAMDMAPRQLLRTKETAYLSLNLDDESKSDREIIDAMLAHPELIERPIVVTEKGANSVVRRQGSWTFCNPKHPVSSRRAVPPLAVPLSA